MDNKCTGVILAGGRNTRFPGRKKTFRRVGGQTILSYISRVFSELFSEVIIVVNEPGEFAGLDMMVVTDIDPSRCALSGLHAGLFYASNPYVYVTACDTPFIHPDVIKYMIDKIHPDYDIILPRTEFGVEPLSAVYSKKCIQRIEQNLQDKILMIKKSFKKRKVREIPADHLKALDPELKFIFNVNTKNDLETANRMAGNISGDPGKDLKWG